MYRLKLPIYEYSIIFWIQPNNLTVDFMPSHGTASTEPYLRDKVLIEQPSSISFLYPLSRTSHILVWQPIIACCFYFICLIKDSIPGKNQPLMAYPNNWEGILVNIELKLYHILWVATRSRVSFLSLNPDILLPHYQKFIKMTKVINYYYLNPFVNLHD